MRGARDALWTGREVLLDLPAGTVPDGSRTPIHLTILRQGDRNLVDLAERGSLIPRSETHVDDDFLRDLTSETAHLAAAARGGGPAAARALERVGGLVFSHLLTEPARALLREAAPGDLYLRLDERLVHVPWELCHDGRDFLATKFRVGRQVITTRRIPDQAAPRGERLRILLVADPTETLPQAGAEADQLCSLLDALPGVDVTLLGGKSVRRLPLLAALQEHDVVHFAGHSHYDAAKPSRSGWRLAEGLLTAAELVKLRPSPLLVFSNSCEAGTGPAWEGGYGYEGHAFGIGSAFLLAGARNYVGTFWVVHDEESVLFATACYRALATGASLGEALLEARHAIIAQRGWHGLTWASYLLYGDPAFTPLPKDPSAPATLPQPAAMPNRQYRFAVQISARAGEAEATAVGVLAPLDAQMVGREQELGRLGQAFDLACRGTRRTVFVCGPAGIGKTTLVDAFLERVRNAGDAYVARGQSVEQYGAGEAYLPVLEAWARLARDAGGTELVDQLRQHAPTWLAQLPALLDPAEHGELRDRVQGATRERMLREMAELLEVVTAKRPMVLVLEDLHWSDHSTLELIAYVAQRRSLAHLLLIGTYRSAEAKRRDSPLRAISQELQARRCSEDLLLTPLAPHDVGTYLRGRLAGGEVEDDLARLIHDRTEGHPLFLVNVVDFALREGLLADVSGRWALRGGTGALESAVPDSLRQMIERQLETLTPEERHALEAASVAGAQFSIAAVAAALQTDAEALDDRCEGLAWKGFFIVATGVEEWPDGTISGRYRFVHALYRDVLYERVAEARRIRLHRRIAEHKVDAFGPNGDEIAGELAAHFEAARDTAQAVSYHAQAGDTAVARHADHEAIEHFTQALRQLASLPETPARRDLDLSLQVKLATPLMSTRGYAAPEVERVFERAHALSRQATGGPARFPLLRGLASFYQVRAQASRAHLVGEELLALCERTDDRVVQVQAHYGQGVTLYDLVELDASQQHLERALALYDPETHPIHVSVYGGYDPGVACRCWLGWGQWLRGVPDQALRNAEEGLALAERLGHPFTLDFALLATAMLRLFRWEVQPALGHLERAIAISNDEGFAYQRAVGALLEGWAMLMRGRPDDAVSRLRESLAGHEATGTALARPSVLALLAHATGMAGRLDEALGYAAEGIADAERTGQRIHLVQLNSTRGDLLLWGGDAPDRAVEAERCFRRALDLASDLRTPMLELRAATNLARLWSQQGRSDAVPALLAPLVGAFSEGLDLHDLRIARALLEQ
jgi:tetratricopeptide (TPR) repeat protein